MPQPPYSPFWPIGSVAVAATGTPVQLLAAYQGGKYLSVNTNAKVRVVSILFAVISGINANTGFVYVGVKGMNKSTGAGVIFAIPASAAGIVSWFTLPAQGWGGGNEICAEDIWLDADTSGNSVIVTLTQY